MSSISTETMAAFLRHGVFKTSHQICTKNFVADYGSKVKSWQLNRDKKVGPKIDSSAESLAAKGFLRPQKEYTPPNDISTKLSYIFQRILGSYDSQTHIKNNNEKFELLTACNDEFKHPVPNSLLHTIETVEDIENFYNTPVNTVVPYDALKNMELPENLNIQYEYHRFHPETDTMFNGITAFPKSSTLVTGLKYKNKYPGHLQKNEWADN